MSRKRNRKAKKTTGVELNFDGVETTSRVPDGDYLVRVANASLEDTKDGDSQYIRFGLSIIDGTHTGKNLRHTNSLKPNALFALRNTLEALGYPIPAGSFDLDLDEITGLEMAVAVENEEYNGKDQSRVVDVFSSDDYEIEDDEDEDEDDEEEEETPKRKKKKSKPEPEEDEDDEDEDAEDEDDDEDDDEEEDEDDGEDSDDDSEDDEDDEDEDDEDDELEDYTEEELKEMDQEELEEAADEYDVKPKFRGKGDKLKFNKAGTIKAILAAIEEDDED